MTVLIQPHQHKRPHIAIVSPRTRQEVAALINPVFQPLIDGANVAIETVIEENLFEPVTRSDHQFKVAVANPTELRLYLDQGVRPPRFPAGGRKRLQAFWRARPTAAHIEVTEFLTVIALRAVR